MIKAKTGIIKAINFNPENYSEVVRNSFTDVIQGGEDYKVLTAFEHYFNEHFDHVFDTAEGYQEWLENGVDKEIVNVQYDWIEHKALITIADTNFPGPHEFECSETWTDQDCINAINKRF